MGASRRGEQTEGLRRGSVPAPLSALVKVVQQGRVLRTMKLTAGTCRVGAAGDCDLVLDDAAVSRAHLELTVVPEGIHVRDLGSRNGTFYAGQRIGEITLALGGAVTLGTTELRFEADVEDFEGTQGRPLLEYGGLRGTSPLMQRLYTLLERLEGSLVNVLIEGESGTGKELVARALHDHSALAGRPFVAVNCGALDRALIRSELFGHKKGAFTGAVSESIGALGEAAGGTLFLDEVGELPLDVQPVLLRVLESGTYTRVGETKERFARVRVIAATNRSLQSDVEEGTFRQDLYYRLMVVRLSLSPLRHRPEDIPVLARHLAPNLGILELPDEVVAELQRRSFPGNVRELKHALAAYAALGELPEEGARAGVQVDGLDAMLRAFVDLERPYAELKEEIVERLTRVYLEQLLERTGGNRSEAARVADLQRGYLRRLLEKYGLG